MPQALQVQAQAPRAPQPRAANAWDVDPRDWWDLWNSDVAIPSSRFLLEAPGGMVKMAIEIVSFSFKKMVIFHSYVSLPEGI